MYSKINFYDRSLTALLIALIMGVIVSFIVSIAHDNGNYYLYYVITNTIGFSSAFLGVQAIIRRAHIFSVAYFFAAGYMLLFSIFSCSGPQIPAADRMVSGGTLSANILPPFAIKYQQEQSAEQRADTLLKHSLIFYRRNMADLQVHANPDTNTQVPSGISSVTDPIPVSYTILDSVCAREHSGSRGTSSTQGASSATMFLVRKVLWSGSAAYILQMQDPDMPCLHQILVRPADILTIASTEAWSHSVDALEARLRANQQRDLQQVIQSITPFAPEPHASASSTP